MGSISAKLTLALAALSLAWLAPGRASAQQFAPGMYAPPPAVACYSPPLVYSAPQVSYYYAPAVSYYTPAVSYYPTSVAYYAPSVSYYAAPAYAAPAVSYYAASAAVTTTRYGLFGRPRVSSTYFYP
ncbi:MAG TPA: hypothetical protein VG099_10960 [Gemmataceae bacterium]|jgi:hypothetical protein|nr:hypothetical protein [Gemmataceae bacterium]